MTVLKDVGGMAYERGVSVESIMVEEVGLIDIIPVDLTESLVVLPETGIIIVIVEILLIDGSERAVGKGTLGRVNVIVAPGVVGIIIGGEITVIIGTRVSGLIPVEGRAGIAAHLEADTGIDGSPHTRLPYPVE